MVVLLAVALVMLAVVCWPVGRRGAGSTVTPGSTVVPGSTTGAEERGRADGIPALGSDATVEDAADALVLCGLVLRAGLAPVEALEAVAAHVPHEVGHQLRVVASGHRWGQDSAQAWARVGDVWRPAALAWQAAERSGAAPAAIVFAAAERMRREESSRVEAAVQRAGVMLVLPLGVCFLPAFVGTTVVPVVLHLARTTLSATL